MRIRVLSGGAAQGVVAALAGAFRERSGHAIDGTFGAVGAMKEKLLAGEPADAVILTEALVEELAAAGRVLRETSAPLGIVRAGIAVPRAAPPPDISTAEALRAALIGAGGIYFPDPERATAGIHFARVLERLGIAREVGPRLRPLPNGAAAMRAMGDAGRMDLIGCTQMTEILNTPTVALVGPLPAELELATVYCVAVAAKAAARSAAGEFAALVSGKDSAALRRECGFETE